MLPELRIDMVGDDAALKQLQTLVVGATGNAWLENRESLLLEKITRRLGVRGLPSLDAYLAFLRESDAGEDELDCLIAELTIGETSFFRHAEQFNALRDTVLPACLERNRGSRQLRIWSAGCANGAEAYSISTVVHEALGPAIAEWNVTIVGSDINRAFLAYAEQGRYSAWAFRNVPPEAMLLYFTEEEGKLWSVKDEYRRNVRFVRHNLITEEVPLLHKNIFAFDVIFCRNVMIYFDAETNLAFAQRLGEALVDDGYLFTAPADYHSHLLRFFTTEKVGGATVLRKKQEGLPQIMPSQALAGAAAPAARGSETEANGVSRTKPRPAVARAARRWSHTDRLSRSPSRSASRSPARVVAGTPPQAAALPDTGAIIASANKGDWAEAIRHCEGILKADACNVAAHYYLGLVLQNTGSRADAEAAWRRVIYLDRNFALAHYQFGLSRKDAGDVDGSRKAFRNAADALSETPDETPVSPCDQITAAELKELAALQLDLLGRP